MAKKKMNMLIAGMLSEVTVVTDQEVNAANDSVSEAVIGIEEPLEDAVIIADGIEATEGAVEAAEAGLQSGVDLTSARLLVAGLNNAIKKLDSGYMVATSGLQDDTKNTTLEEAINSAKEVLIIAKDSLGTLTAKVADNIAILDNSLSTITKWAGQGGVNEEKAKESSEALTAISELVEKIKENQESLPLPEESAAQIENIETNVDTLDTAEAEEMAGTGDENNDADVIPETTPVENADATPAGDGTEENPEEKKDEEEKTEE